MGTNQIILLLDNATAHKSQMVQEFMKMKALKVVYNAPFSPDFAPVELLFNWLKRKISKVSKDHEKKELKIIPAK